MSGSPAEEGTAADAGPAVGDYEQLRACFFECAAVSGVITWVWPDCSQRFLWFPGVMMDALGYGPGDLQPDIDTVVSLVHPDDRVSASRTVASIVTEGRVGDFETEWRLRRKDGSYSWVRGLTSVVRRRGSLTLCAFGLARITDADKQPERSVLKLTQDALHTVLNEIGHPVVLMSVDGHVVQANEAAARVVGRTLALCAGAPYCPFLHEENGSPVIPDFLSEVVRTGRRKDREFRRFDRWWHIYLVPLQNTEHEVRRVLLLAQDITSIKERQAEQLAREKALTRTLVREVHHRIKNHLQGLVGLLRSYASSEHSAREAIDAAVAQILTIATVHGLLAQEGRASIELTELVGRIVATLRVGSAVPLRLTVESSPWPPTVLSQEEAVPLAAAIGELITNAIKHTEHAPGASVEGRLSHDEEGIELNIVNGPAHLPAGFSLSSGSGPHTGLDLARALLPRNRSQLEIFQDGQMVKTRLRLKPLAGRGAQ